MPPDTETVAEPLALPLQLTFVFVAVAVIALGCVIVTDRIAVQPFVSVKVQV